MVSYSLEDALRTVQTGGSGSSSSSSNDCVGGNDDDHACDGSLARWELEAEKEPHNTNGGTTEAPSRAEAVPVTQTQTEAQSPATPAKPPKQPVPLLSGTLALENGGRGVSLNGTWQYEGPAPSPVFPFELSATRDNGLSGPNTDLSRDGSLIFSGKFVAPSVHVTMNGKQSLRNKTFRESSVRIEFRSLSRSPGNEPNALVYRVEGSGKNHFGTFVLHGTARRGTSPGGWPLSVVLKKIYRGIPEDPVVVDEEISTFASPIRKGDGAGAENDSDNQVSDNANANENDNNNDNDNSDEDKDDDDDDYIHPSIQAAVEAKRESLSPQRSMATGISPDQQQETPVQEPPDPMPSDNAIDPPRDAEATRQADQRNDEERRRREELQRRTKQQEQEALQRRREQQEQEQREWEEEMRRQRSSSPSSSAVDQVNGRGMWHAWTRSFDTPLLALLDLFDNAVDASWTLLPEGKNPDRPVSSGAVEAIHRPKIRVDMDTIGRNGVVLINASRFIPPLKQVLQVYKSSKAGDADNSIGENGIGVKHACASLSTLSFVFTKTTRRDADGSQRSVLSMGILMQELQRDDGIVLPSVGWTLDADGERARGADSENEFVFEIGDLETKLEAMCDKHPRTWGRAVREYGGYHRKDGIDQCLQHMDVLLSHRDWRDCDNVFCVVLTNLKHAAFDQGAGDDDHEQNEAVTIEIEDHGSPVRARRNGSGREAPGPRAIAYHEVQRGGDDDEDEDAQRSLSLLHTLRDQLPYLYLHLHDLDVCVQGSPIESIYWERRLAELSRFELQVSQTELWSKISKSRYEPNHVRNVYEIDDPSKVVRFFCGFDPYRCRVPVGSKTEGGEGSDKTAMTPVPGGNQVMGGNNSALKVYLYSRQSGRLIKVRNDPRNELGLTGGSTDFCQGMTVIIDDYNGTLPLNPTKQDTAYGHSKHGQIHASNVSEWTAAIAHFYWNYYYYRLGDSKTAIREAVLETKPSLEEAYRHYQDREQIEEDNDFVSIVPLCKGTFISYDNVDFTLRNYRGVATIRCNKKWRETAVPKIARHEVVRFSEEFVASATKRRAATAKKKRDTLDLAAGHRVSQRVTSLEVVGPPPAKRLRSSHHDEARIDLLRDDNNDDGGGGENSDHPQQPPNGDQAYGRVSDGRTESFEERGRQDGGSHPQAAVGFQVQHLHQQLQQAWYDNSRLEQECSRWRRQDAVLQQECQNLRLAKAANERELYDLKTFQLKARGDVERLVAEVEHLRNRGAPPQHQPNQFSPGGPAAEHAQVDKLRREVQVYKSRAEFYKKETESKKAQIENLVQERRRFEERVQELEDAQLDDNGGSNPLESIVTI
ncbi:unnamed protein product [Pseudo-nitzschia multistriata]|uniref:Uncharacterized protein n=1 Tax=Pseudo-nitzschia multistriata TaxID=183589 RepID=A0A448ZDL2_9STRA|nr:unnamed protein product [Pseudo-nitzschia multistriata]